MSEDDKPSVKAKLPSAKEISRKDFKPHGIKSKGASRPSGLTAAQVKKRQRIGIAIGVVVLLAVAGGTTYFLTRPAPAVKVTGAFGKMPAVSIPKDMKPATKLSSKQVVKGKGPALGKDDTAYFKFVGYDWSTKGSKQLHFGASQGASSSAEYDTAQSLPMSATAQEVQNSAPLLGTLEKALKGANVGSRFVLEIPPAAGYGDQGNPNAGVNPTDAMVWVIDVVAKIGKNADVTGTMQQPSDPKLPTVKDNGPGKAPTLTIPKSDPPAATSATVLIPGTGPAVAKGQTILVQYQGQIWSSGQVFDSTWAKTGQPTPFSRIGEGGLVPGMDKSLLGQKVGSRLLITIPPADGYGKDGNSQAGIKGTDTLVFVVDIVAAF